MLKTTLVDYVSVGTLSMETRFVPYLLAHWHPTEVGIVMYV